MGFKQILVPIADSPLSESALDYVEKIAEPGARIHLLSVAARATAQALQAPFEVQGGALTRDVNWQSTSAESEEQSIYKHEGRLKSLSSRLAGKGYNVTTEVEFGSVTDTILEIAKSGFDVIVMTTHGRSGLARLVAGSVSEDVLHKAPCPLLLIPARVVTDQENNNEGGNGQQHA